MQINHPGRQCPQSINPHPLAPSEVTLEMLGGGFGQPRAATESEIAELIRRFAHVATVARATGFTGVQIHAAHGYLISQFLSPIANRRTDQWGGSLENRARFLLRVVRAVRAAVGTDFPISVKLNSADFQVGGFSNEEAQQVVKWLGAERIDLLELSGGTYEQLVMIGAGSDAAEAMKTSTRQREAYFLKYASLIKPVATMPVMVTGGFRTRGGMQDALGDSSVEMIGLGRPMCVDPEIAGKLLRQEADSAPMWEQRLSLPADALGPDVAPEMHRQIETWGKQGWFCLQLIRLGNGLSPDLEMSVLDAFHGYTKNEADAAASLQRG
jgi:2,4-dienoyl-CoA reductase-like NADH-dependent reductase (Old Yellow Enzyme family)